MNHLSYKSFTWPQNPHTYMEKTSREPKYVMYDGAAYFDGLGELKRTITGSGTFYGPDAYTKFKELEKLLEDQTAGDLYHPIWGARYCYFTGLEMTQEPKENVVSYTFTFMQALPSGVIPK